MPEEKVVTQEEFNRIYRLYKEGEEKLEVVVAKLNTSEAEKVNVLERIKALEDKNKERPPAYVPPAEGEQKLSEVYTEQTPPQTEQEWNDLYDENPTYAHDLKIAVGKTHKSWKDERKNAADELQKKHPDMYLRNEDGSFKRFKVDERGNYVKVAGKPVEDPQGIPHMDVNSDKGKIWMGLATDPKFLASARAPLIIMSAMENEYRKGKDKEMAKKIEEEKKNKDKEKEAKADKTKVAGGGGNPPVEEPKVEIKYNSKEEEAYVKDRVAKGFWKSEEEYFLTKEKGNVIPAGRGGF
jgi:hypothetical protein